MAITQQQADVVVIGSGPAGYPCAIRLAQLGKKVIVIEKGDVGGVCLNVGCIPSKALIYAGNQFEKMEHASVMGIEVKGATLKLPKLMEWKQSVVKKLTGGVSQLLKANGCTVIEGEARFAGPKTLEVKNKSGVIQLTFNQCVIATGSRPMKLPGFDVSSETGQKQIIDSTGALSLEELPRSMLCIGGGYIGLELGTFYSKVGTQVTVVEAYPALLGMADPALTSVVQRKLEKRGVKIMLNTKVKSQKTSKKGVEVTFEKDGKAFTETFEIVLVTIGRVPNHENLGLEKAGVKLDAKGFVLVDAQRRTNVSGIYAIGDIAGQPLLAHKGTKEGLVCAEVIAGKKTVYDVVAMPAVIFTDPEIATVGMSEAEAKQKGLNVSIGIFPFAANGRALSVGEPDGIVKMIGEAKTGRLLGVHIVGPEASNLISECALALEMGASVEDIALTVHPHPTLPETLMEAADTTLGHPIHIFQRSARSAVAEPNEKRPTPGRG